MEGYWVKRGLWVVFLMAVILALTVPLTINLYQSEQAFTPDNLLFIHTSASSQYTAHNSL
jgi:hypothetical protein